MRLMKVLNIWRKGIRLMDGFAAAAQDARECVLSRSLGFNTPPPLVVDEATGGRLEAAVDAIPGGVAEGCFMSMTFSRIGMTNRGKTGFFYSQEGTNQ